MALGRWEVVSGSDGGIIVRSDADLRSQRAVERLSFGAIVEGLGLEGNRLQYRKLKGSGPEEGWVSVRLNDKELLRPCAEDPEQPLAPLSSDESVKQAQYCLLRCDSTGEYLVALPLGRVASKLHAADDGMWALAPGGELVSALGGMRLLPVGAASAPRARGDCGIRVHLRLARGEWVASDGQSSTVRESAGHFTVLAGPSKLPSEHLAEMQEKGYTVLPRVLLPASIAHLKAEMARVRSDRYSFEPDHDGHFWMMDVLRETPALGRALAHPVAQWLLQKYMGEEELHCCHQPIVNVLRPAQALLLGRRPDNGQNDWHADYPYHEGRLVNDEWPKDRPLAVQFNICIDAFRCDNGATQLLPGTHARNSQPPPDLLISGRRSGEALQQAVQAEAPAGAAILYDARTWHRQCPELNTSGRDRIAVLNAVSPSWVVPMLDKVPEAEAYMRSSVPSELNPRDRKVVAGLCCNESWAWRRGIVVGNPRDPRIFFGKSVRRSKKTDTKLPSTL